MLAKCLLAALLVIGAQAAEEDVLELTDADFSSELERHENTLVMFYAPWCGHCKRLKPEYAKAAELLKYNNPPITLAKIDCTEAGKETCNKYSVSGYPTLKIFSGIDMVNEYNGPREAAGIAKYMKAQVGPASKQLNDLKSFKELMNSDEVVVVGFFEKKDSSLANAFHTTAKKLKEKVQFAHTSAKDILEKEEMKDNIMLYRPKRLHNKFEESSLLYKGEAKAEEIANFITKNYHGICGIRTRDNMAEFKIPLVVAYYAVDYVKNPRGTNYWRNRIIKIGKEYPEFTFAISSNSEFQNELNEFGIDYIKGDRPIILARDAKNRKFSLKEFTMDLFDEFMTDLKDDELVPYLKSEDIPTDNSGPVIVAVANSFDKVVNENGKDTLIEFYAPWCGHCKKLAPVFEELGEKMANEDIAIVKFDATANDVPAQYEVRGFPTLFWVPKNDKNNPVKYEGGRELNDFIKYIAQHATEPLKGYDRSGKPVKPASDEL